MGRDSQMSFRIRHVQGTISPEMKKSSDGHWIEEAERVTWKEFPEGAVDGGELSA